MYYYTPSLIYLYDKIYIRLLHIIMLLLHFYNIHFTFNIYIYNELIYIQVHNLFEYVVNLL